jgi:hypothetical protein
MVEQLSINTSTLTLSVCQNHVSGAKCHQSIVLYTKLPTHYHKYTVGRQMLAIILIWRVEKIAKLKRHYFPFHC